MRREAAQALRAALGQVDMRSVLTASVSGALMWFGGTTWERYGTAAELRREVMALRSDVDRHNTVLVSLPAEELKGLPAKVERIEAAVGAVEKLATQIANSVQRKK